MPDLIADVLAHFTEFGRELAATAATLAKHGATGEAKAVDAVRLDLSERIRAVNDEYQWLDTYQYATLHGVTGLTVARWCKHGELAAEQTPKGWRIRRTAVRQKPRA